MNTKPSLKSYYRKPINIYYTPVIKDKETGVMYEEVNGKLHNYIISVITGVGLVILVYLVTKIAHYVKNTFLLILCFIAPLVISLALLTILRGIFYMVSKFRVICEDDFYKHK